jgi:hypothetical protein
MTWAFVILSAAAVVVFGSGLLFASNQLLFPVWRA